MRNKNNSKPKGKKNNANQTVTPEKEIQKKRRRALDKRDIANFFSKLIVLVLFIVILFQIVFRMIPVANDDMRPTLRARDLQLVYRFPSNLYSEDIVAYEQDGKTKTGRIIGRPNDTVEITEENQVVVNGYQVYEPDIYYSTPPYDSGVAYPLQLGPDEYFILSDYREGAEDSRQFGPVKQDSIIGKVVMVLRRSGL